MLTLSQTRDAIALLRRGLWPAVLGPPPSAVGPEDPVRSRTVCGRYAEDLEHLLAGDEEDHVKADRRKSRDFRYELLHG